jgi:hypothetical protein
MLLKMVYLCSKLHEQFYWEKMGSPSTKLTELSALQRAYVIKLVHSLLQLI